MTAEEFMNQEEYEPDSGISFSDYHGDIADSCQVLMVDFARYHVEQALEAAFNNSEMRVSENDTSETPSFTDNYDDGYVTITVSKNSIINAYPETNIK